MSIFAFALATRSYQGIQITKLLTVCTCWLLTSKCISWVTDYSVWRACCYFIILSVVFPDGDRSLLVFPSDLLARWCELGFIVVLVSWSSLSSSQAVRQRLYIYMCEKTNTCLTGAVSLCVRGWSCPVQFHQMHFDDDSEQTCGLCSVRRKWLRRK